MTQLKPREEIQIELEEILLDKQEDYERIKVTEAKSKTIREIA